MANPTKHYIIKPGHEWECLSCGATCGAGESIYRDLELNECRCQACQDRHIEACRHYIDSAEDQRLQAKYGKYYS